MGYSRDIRGVFAEYSWGIHGVFICIGYVSVMYRLSIGYLSEQTRSWEGFDNLDERNRSSCSLRSRNLNKSYYNTTYSILRTP